jgi:hypothetical protein
MLADGTKEAGDQRKGMATTSRKNTCCAITSTKGVLGDHY